MVLQLVKLGIGRLIGQAGFLRREWLELVARQLFEQLGKPEPYALAHGVRH